MSHAVIHDPAYARLGQSGTGPALIQSDARADQGRRAVRLYADRVVIDRTIAGTRMRLGVPTESFLGVCICLKAGPTGGGADELRLAHPLDDRTVWADWRAWAKALRLPALIERNDGLERWGDEPAAPSTTSAPRRAKRRRAPFVVRRHATPGLPGQVHRERELIARD